MSSIYIERRAINKGNTLSRDIANHLYTRAIKGGVIIVSEHPKSLLASIRKQWLRVSKRLLRENASTFNVSLRAKLSLQVDAMNSLIFTIDTDKAPASSSGALLISPQQIAGLRGSGYHTAYITCCISQKDEDLLATLLVKHGLMVMYGDIAQLFVV